MAIKRLTIQGMQVEVSEDIEGRLDWYVRVYPWGGSFTFVDGNVERPDSPLLPAGRSPRFTVNWPSCGSRPPKEAALMARAIRIAAKLVAAKAKEWKVAP